jgi:hypothetical protein
MGNNCAYCGTYFEAKRSHKKYCSDNCKQMAYFTRNGFTFSGIGNSASKNEPNSSLQENVVTKESANVKYDSTAEPIVKYSTEKENVKYDKEQEAVKCEKKETDFTVSENTEQKTYCAPPVFERAFLNEIKTPIRYCAPCQSSVLKQRNESTTPEIKEEQNSTQKNETHKPTDSGKPLPDTKENETPSKQKEKAPEVYTETFPEEKPYQWLSSKFIRQVEFFIASNDNTDVLKNPLRYWSHEQAKQVSWVNVRFLCLIESVIRLSHYSQIDLHTLCCMSDAFGKLCNSYAYNNLPGSYPYTELIAELCANVFSMQERNRDKRTFSFKLTLQRKAQLVAIRYSMHDVVPSTKFSELDFTEEQANTAGKSQIPETTEVGKDKAWRGEFEAWKRNRKQKEAA